MSLNTLAQTYVQLVLSVGQHDSSYVDAYYGPPEWQAQTVKRPLADLLQQAEALAEQFAQLPAPPAAEQTRQTFLGKHIAAVRVHVDHLMGRRQIFDQESQGLYDAVSPPVSETELAPEKRTS